MKEDNYYLIKQYFDNLINYAKMKEESKYYTPEHEDMLIGLEYQIFQGKPVNPAESGWKVLTFDGGHFGLEKAIKAGLVIVKRLDREDIESLEYIKIDKHDYSYSDEVRYLKDTSLILHNNHTKTVVIYRNYDSSDNGSIAFSGTVKNKSELVKILKMIGI